jgi:hypothetical protein
VRNWNWKKKTEKKTDRTISSWVLRYYLKPGVEPTHAGGMVFTRQLCDLIPPWNVGQ